MLVLDTSMALSWFFVEEQTNAKRAVLDRVTRSGATVTSLWRLEIANALQASVRRRRVIPSFRDEALEQLDGLKIDTDPHTDIFAWRETLRLSDRFGLTVYDAAYLELARRLRLPLASLDKALVTAARASELEVLTGA